MKSPPDNVAFLAELGRLMPHFQSPDQLKETNTGFGYSKGETDGIRAICLTPLGYYKDSGLPTSWIGSRKGRSATEGRNLSSCLRTRMTSERSRSPCHKDTGMSNGNTRMSISEYVHVTSGFGLIDGGYDPKVVVHEDSGRAVWKISI